MNGILIWTAVVLVAALITAIIVWPSKPKTYEMDSAEIFKALRGK